MNWKNKNKFKLLNKKKVIYQSKELKIEHYLRKYVYFFNF